MKKVNTYISIIFICAFSLQSIAQTDSIKQNEKTQIKLSLNYNSGLNYYGRTDSLRSSGFFPLAEIWFNTHFYINAAPVFIHNSVQSTEYAGTVASFGYQNVSNKWMTNLYVLKPFYKQNSELPQSALKVQSGLNLSFLNKILNLNAGADIKYSNQLDYGASVGIDHLIRIQNKNNSAFIINPSAYIYAGTQNFTNSYYQKKNSFLLFPGLTQQVSDNVQQFSILSYEFSMPLIYVKENWQFLITPTYVMPKNLINIPGHPEQSEKGSDMFYTSITLKYILQKNK